MTKTTAILMAAMVCAAARAGAQEPADTILGHELDEVSVAVRRPGTTGLAGAETGFRINRTELFRAACCNLGESFTTNPSVDVDYEDPATGAKQIKLMGLSGAYVQMMTENLPAFRGAARPYAFRYVPGPWMKSIRVSKGATTVKNGYEAITGQIDIEYLKPQDEKAVNVNAYFDSDLRLELNADANFHVTDRLNTEVMGHYEDRFRNHDSNHDGFADMPSLRQVNLMNRWNYFGDNYIFHGGISVIGERSRAGQTAHGSHRPENPYLINLNDRRYDGYMKHAFILNRDHNTNLALAGNLSMYLLHSAYGLKLYDVNEKSAYAQLMFETDFTESHNLSAGLSLNYDFLGQRLRRLPSTDAPQRIRERELTPGAYVQYTFKAGDKFMAMAGVRADHSSDFGMFVTPRFNVRYQPVEKLTLKASAGKGYRTVHPWAEFNYLLASGRELAVADLEQEQAWNVGISAQLTIPVGAQTLRASAEYFRTDFSRQAVVDYDSSPGLISIANLRGDSYSNVVQLQLDFESSVGLSATAAWRLNDVKTTYSGRLMEKALTSKYKALLTVSYKTPLELWQFDATFVMNGGGRMPTPYELADGSMSWSRRFPAFPSLNVQVTRWFRHFSIYAGGENLTNFRQKDPVINAADPWSSTFEPTMVWGTVTEAMGYIGLRLNF